MSPRIHLTRVVSLTLATLLSLVLLGCSEVASSPKPVLSTSAVPTVAHTSKPVAAQLTSTPTTVSSMPTPTQPPPTDTPSPAPTNTPAPAPTDTPTLTPTHTSTSIPTPTPTVTPTDTLVPPTPTPGPLDLIKAFESAMNRGDTDAALDMFVDEGLEHRVLGDYVTDKEGLTTTWT